MATLDTGQEGKNPAQVDLAALRAFVPRLYDGWLPIGAVEGLIAERRREVERELALPSGHKVRRP